MVRMRSEEAVFSTVTLPSEAGEEDLIPIMKLSEIKNLTEGDRLSC